VSFDGGDVLYGGKAKDKGNKFIIGNTSENGDTVIKDFWIDQRNTIEAKDEECAATEAVFTYDDLAGCLESALWKPDVNIRVDQCVVEVYFGQNIDNETERCILKDLMCPELQIELEAMMSEVIADFE